MLPIILAVVLSQTPVANQIRELHPDLPQARIASIASAIESAALYYGQDPALLVRIVHVETEFESRVACWPAPWKGRHARTCDYGLAQINDQWVRRWNLDPERLLHDDLYNLTIAAKILADIEHRYAARERYWYTRYHSGTPSLRAEYAARLAHRLPANVLVSR